MAHRTHTVDDYLEALYFLAFPVGEYGPIAGSGRPAPAARVAEMLQVTPPTASEMFKRLESDGLVERAGRRPLLTAKGRAEAERVVRHHRIIERFLTDFMGYSPAESHVHADAMGEAFDDDMVERLAERLGHPERCPHGWPVDPAHEQAENLELVPLSQVAAGARATIVRLAEHDGDLLHWFYDNGLVPGTPVTVVATEPAAGQLTIALGDDTRAIAEKAAAGLFVRVADPAGA
jgi:DtxR family transcriptional regulator, Mn-dependent transcriptional regulator